MKSVIEIDKNIYNALQTKEYERYSISNIYRFINAIWNVIKHGTPLKTGHWVGIDEYPHEEWECDRCGFVIDGSGCIDPIEYRDIYNYCPNCGADMRADKEQEE